MGGGRSAVGGEDCGGLCSRSYLLSLRIFLLLFRSAILVVSFPGVEGGIRLERVKKKGPGARVSICNRTQVIY